MGHEKQEIETDLRDVTGTNVVVLLLRLPVSDNCLFASFTHISVEGDEIGAALEEERAEEMKSTKIMRKSSEGCISCDMYGTFKLNESINLLFIIS